MTETETLKHAKKHIDKLANGIDPLTDQPVPDGDCINQLRISRCLFYVSSVLDDVIKSKEPKARKKPFSITQKELKKYRISQFPISVTEIARRINELIDNNTMCKLKHSSIAEFLEQSGLLEKITKANGKTERRPTKNGEAFGITVRQWQNDNGTYTSTVYNIDAQRFILDNIDGIIEINRQKTAK